MTISRSNISFQVSTPSMKTKKNKGSNGKKKKPSKGKAK